MNKNFSLCIVMLSETTVLYISLGHTVPLLFKITVTLHFSLFRLYNIFQILLFPLIHFRTDQFPPPPREKKRTKQNILLSTFSELQVKNTEFTNNEYLDYFHSGSEFFIENAHICLCKQQYMHSS